MPHGFTSLPEAVVTNGISDMLYNHTMLIDNDISHSGTACHKNRLRKMHIKALFYIKLCPIIVMCGQIC